MELLPLSGSSMRSNGTASILVVDDDRIFRLSTSALLRDDGHDVVSIDNGRQAVEVSRRRRFDLMLLDMRMPGTDGLGVIEQLRLEGQGIPVLMISGYGTVDGTVRALHLGADDFLTKPVEPAVLSARVRDLLERRPRSAVAGEEQMWGMVGRCAAMQEVFEAIRRVGPTDVTVLVTGETGTGKELVARAVHQSSPRRGGPFVAVDCGAFAEGLMESELFGHVRGAFTGAVQDKPGLFEASAGGTLFLDEIGDVSPALQQRLLRVIQEREVRRVGSIRTARVDVRLIAATSRDLAREVADGRFREDLFYRLNVFPIALPLVREREADIPLLIQDALDRVRDRGLRRGPLACSPLALRMLRAYPWPGNVRQLFSAIESAAIRARGERIEAQDLPPEVRESSGRCSGEEGRYRADAVVADERAAILAALDSAEGSRIKAGEMLGMSRTTLWRKMRAYGVRCGVDPELSRASSPAI